MIVPGNGCLPIEDANWYSWLARELRSVGPQLEVICETMPDPFEAKERHWIPFIREKLGFEESVDPEFVPARPGLGAIGNGCTVGPQSRSGG